MTRTTRLRPPEDSRSESRQKKTQELERRAYELVKDGRLSNNEFQRQRDIGKKIEENPAIGDQAAAGKNGTATKEKRALIEKVGQLKAPKAGFGRLKDMPFMKARRISQIEKDGKVPRPNIKKWDDIAKYADKLNYFEEFCKEVTEPLVECDERTARELTEDEKEGLNIMLTIRTTRHFHDLRLLVLFETWLSVVDPRTVYLVTDGDDRELDEITENIGMHYINAQSGNSHSRTDLCCKAGVELELMFFHDNESYDWICHIDDDIYVNHEQLIKTLAKFDPKREPIYFGRSGSPYETPRLVKNNSKLGTPNMPYHFAVGGMYCLSRKMLAMVKDYLIGCEAFRQSCQATREPEDVTVGLVIGAVLGHKLSRTEMIYTHGVDLLSFVPSPYLDQQIAFSYGYGSVSSWHHTPNVVYTPGAVFSLDEDTTQFKSIHCSFYPNLDWCIEKKKRMALALEAIKERPKPGEKRVCLCTWKTLMCCETWKEGYRKATQETMKARLQEKAEMAEKKQPNGAKSVGVEESLVGRVKLSDDVLQGPQDKLS